MNIDGISLTPRVLLRAYCKTHEMETEALHMIAFLVQSDAKMEKYTGSYNYHKRLGRKIYERLDHILGAME